MPKETAQAPHNKPSGCQDEAPLVVPEKSACQDVVTAAGPGHQAHQANTIGAIAILLHGGSLDEKIVGPLDEKTIRPLDDEKIVGPPDEKLVGPLESAHQDVAATAGPGHQAKTIGAIATAT
jgi:hypothetical protein